MATAFTPGPWTFSQDDQFGDTRFYVAQQEGAPYTPNYSDVATLIAETCSGDRVAVQQANARLIAAAPEQHELLQTFTEWARQLAARDDLPKGIRSAAAGLHDDGKRLLAKVTGSAP